MLLGCSSGSIAKHPSLSCASGERVRVAGDGSCWLYAVLASLSLLDHAAPAVESPSEVDYSMSQWLLAETQVHVLTHVELFPRAICALSVTTTCSNMGVHFCAIIMLAKSVAPSYLCRAKLKLACSARSSQKSTASTLGFSRYCVSRPPRNRSMEVCCMLQAPTLACAVVRILQQYNAPPLLV